MSTTQQPATTTNQHTTNQHTTNQPSNPPTSTPTPPPHRRLTKAIQRIDLDLYLNTYAHHPLDHMRRDLRLLHRATNIPVHIENCHLDLRALQEEVQRHVTSRALRRLWTQIGRWAGRVVLGVCVYVFVAGVVGWVCTTRPVWGAVGAEVEEGVVGVPRVPVGGFDALEVAVRALEDVVGVGEAGMHDAMEAEMRGQVRRVRELQDALREVPSPSRVLEQRLGELDAELSLLLATRSAPWVFRWDAGLLPLLRNTLGGVLCADHRSLMTPPERAVRAVDSHLGAAKQEAWAQLRQAADLADEMAYQARILQILGLQRGRRTSKSKYHEHIVASSYEVEVCARSLKGEMVVRMKEDWFSSAQPVRVMGKAEERWMLLFGEGEAGREWMGRLVRVVRRLRSISMWIPFFSECRSGADGCKARQLSSSTFNSPGRAIRRIISMSRPRRYTTTRRATSTSTPHRRATTSKHRRPITSTSTPPHLRPRSLTGSHILRQPPQHPIPPLSPLLPPPRLYPPSPLDSPPPLLPRLRGLPPQWARRGEVFGACGVEAWVRGGGFGEVDLDGWKSGLDGREGGVDGWEGGDGADLALVGRGGGIGMFIVYPAIQNVATQRRAKTRMSPPTLTRSSPTTT
ncbi:hypothetical protein Tdes44962_MAKER08084 [Teratosphaeria destructans]|uniref:Uncharacterized protein n=1 Tax=Teratosphaeria destructans TaxID=418781 RepID=A0A9W7SY31_9PEZI|nr:hypothetical protein Tdes44962_MAKER08084 [Teratosphaeria destructans]